MARIHIKTHTTRTKISVSDPTLIAVIATASTALVATAALLAREGALLTSLELARARLPRGSGGITRKLTR